MSKENWRSKVRNMIREIINDKQQPESPPYWDDGPAPLSDEACDEIIDMVRDETS